MTTDQTPRRTTARRIGGGDIGACLTQLHHDRFTDAVTAYDEVRTRDAALGMAHEERVLAGIEVTAPRVVRIPADDAVAATRAALDDGAPIVFGARLESSDGTAVGLPDVLIRFDDGYAPVEVKHHKVLGTSGIDALAVPLATPTDLSGAARVKFRSTRRRDLLQVMHYRRLLTELGCASGRPLGGVIGSEAPYRVVWVDLESGSPSITDEYDGHLSAAIEAIDHGRAHPDDPLVSPWWRSECTRCDWTGVCKPQLEEVGDVTLLSNVSPTVRKRLARDGVTRIDQVADLDPDDPRLPGPAVVLQARARTAGHLLRRDGAGTKLAVPTSPVEVDFDIETYDGRIYLAGFLVTADGSSTYEPIADWTGSLDGERALVEELFARLAGFASDDALVQHWTDYERRTLREAGERHGIGIPGFASVDEWFDAHAVDLCDWARRNLVSPNGYSLKVIAPLCGFSWRDDDPGGRQSEVWFERLVAGDEAMRDRLLAYNEDDVAAQYAIRRWIRANDAGTGPGSAIPTVGSWPPAGVSQSV